MPRYKPMRQRRINRLQEAGFTHKEAVGLTGLRHNGKPVIVLKRKLTRDMMKARKRSRKYEIKDAYDSSFAMAQDLNTNEAWKIFKYYRRQAIDSGVIDETPRKYDSNKPHKKLTADGQIDRDHVRRQAAHYREKQRAGR